MSIGSFTLIKNEAAWIGPHLVSWLPWLDSMCLYDGNSTDGTLDTIKQFQANHPEGHKIILIENKDPKNLQDDYVRLFNECMWTLETDWAIFAHPDMILENPKTIAIEAGIAYYSHIRSFAGNPGGRLFEIKGRARNWKNIYRLRNPGLGAHYHGFYGAQNEDVYFSEITGSEYRFHGENFDKYPYDVMNSGLRIMHFSDVRPYERRLERMKTCLRNQGYVDTWIDENASKHARVSLEDSPVMTFQPVVYPDIFRTWQDSLKAPA